jgi:hypothetical protein
VSEVLRARHEARDKEDQERRKREQDEDEEVVKQYFYKVKKGGAGAALESINEDTDHKDKPEGGVLGDGYGSSEDDEKRDKEPAATVTVKRTALPSSGTTSEPTVQDLLAAKGIALPSSSKPAPTTSKPSMLGIKRKEGSGLGVKLVKKKKLV